ncbi:MarR family winged helix-turn-helix transcriptional regulator [Neptunomonas concharum]|uniref:Winged helix-turn-helix transcriptional regulator n=1 Tax=Neptunomonas concharum TaxID=1031538 RepID=A0A5P1RDE1_9GAMM|nr:MarR family winged helix-turn-helix transcriptional regulator [Neptunomonas concharum]QEQ97617.1 winged helix-turn-helix transcriptional regulator [Neptunomonas concharum]
MDIQITQQLLERLAGLLRSEGRSLLLEHGLQPVQFEALHYLSMCNRYSDTPMGVTEFLGQTKGSVSQSLKILEKKGLITKMPDSKDKRVTHMQVTDAGRAVIAALLPSPQLLAAQALCDTQDIECLNTQLRALLTAMQRANQFRTFGQCASCVHNLPMEEGDFLCRLTNERLSAQDVTLICREHEPKT